MNPNHLLFVRAVAETGSFTKAAARCYVTQPTLSSAIAQLEEELGGRLFVRTTRKVDLTPFGHYVLPSILEVLHAQETLVKQAQVFLHPETKLIRIGTSPLINSRLLGLICDPFQRLHPGVELILREMNLADLHCLLEENQLDFVFGVAGVTKAHWNSVPLYREPLLFLPNRKRVRPRGRTHSVSLKEIADETYVMVPDACGLARTTRSIFRSHRLTLQEYTGEALSYQVLEEWAMLGVGAAILPRSKISPENPSALPIVEASGASLMMSYEAVWIDAPNTPLHVQAFAQHLREDIPLIMAGLAESAEREVYSKPKANRAIKVE